MNVAAVRKMTKLPSKDRLLNLPPQKMTLRCVCGWYTKNVLLTDRERVFQGHLTRGRHVRWLSLCAKREAWEAANPGRKWA